MRDTIQTFLDTRKMHLKLLNPQIQVTNNVAYAVCCRGGGQRIVRKSRKPGFL
jgi:hypothetical protein